MKQRKSFSDYDTSGRRDKVVKVFVNPGEMLIIDDAIRKTERIPDRSAWASRVLLREACRILGYDYPY
jgi:hypothetical protein